MPMASTFSFYKLPESSLRADLPRLHMQMDSVGYFKSKLQLIEEKTPGWLGRSVKHLEINVDITPPKITWSCLSQQYPTPGTNLCPS